MDFEYSFEPVREQDIAQFEEKHGIALPEDYRHFLLQHNGGKPVKRRFHTKNGKVTTSLMLCFPLSPADEPNLEAKYAEYTLGGIMFWRSEAFAFVPGFLPLRLESGNLGTTAIGRIGHTAALTETFVQLI